MSLDSILSMSVDRILSLTALVLSATAILWNIYRDVLLKPRVKASGGVRAMFTPLADQPMMVVLIKAINFGPGDVVCTAIALKNSPLWRRVTHRTKMWTIVQTTPPTPHRLEVGDSVDFIIPYNAKSFLGEEFTHVGVLDSFGRHHWIPRRDARRARAQYQRDFPKRIDPAQR